jgi:type I restriction enzyme M protein
MAHERTQAPLDQPSIIPKEYDWPSLFEYEGIPLERHYRDVLQPSAASPECWA